MRNKKQNWTYIGIALIGIALLLGLDQWTKHLAILHLKDQSNVVLIPGILELEYLENHGAAFGILQNQQWLFTILTILFLGIAFYVFWQIPKTKRYMPIFAVFIVLASGAAGNFIDRVTRKYVVDFIYFSLINFPVFNIADIYLTLSAVTVFIFILFIYKDEDYDRIFGKRSKDGI